MEQVLQPSPGYLRTAPRKCFKIFFLHIEKTGGTTVREFFHNWHQEDKYQACRVPRMNEHECDNHQFVALTVVVVVAFFFIIISVIGISIVVVDVLNGDTLTTVGMIQ